MSQGGAKPALRKAKPVVRSGVEIPDTRIPGGIDGGGGLVIADRLIEVAELGATQRQGGET